MDQRTLRLGDVVDDYCPRERRITNHAIVAIVENTVKKTRCATCDSEHVYKGGKVPRRRKPGAASEDLAGGQLVPPRAEVPVEAEPAEVVATAGAAEVEAAVEFEVEAAPVEANTEAASPEVVSAPVALDDDATGTEDDERPDEPWSTNRRLIRATLPKVEGELPPPRPIPEFTMHQRQGRGGQGFRGQGGNGNVNGNAGGHSRGEGRHGRPGQGNGNPTGNGSGSGGNAKGGRSRGRSGRNRGQNKRPR